MSVIEKRPDVLTLVTVLEVEPHNCGKLLALIERFTSEFISHQHGFISANLHLSPDRTRIIDYGQWASGDLYARARAREEFRTFTKSVSALAERVDPVSCHVVFTEYRHY